jgi:hypothetical protein
VISSWRELSIYLFDKEDRASEVAPAAARRRRTGRAYHRTSSRSCSGSISQRDFAARRTDGAPPRPTDKRLANSSPATEGFDPGPRFTRAVRGRKRRVLEGV